mmetsp:Transcript_13245/g.25398  ORF Transcript_13245/g.25398 Transcript_13245/m.25398 type:complete len:144 (-) Transcript_13245:123-554(-)
MCNGIVGMVFVGFFANDKYVETKDQAGIFYGHTGKQLRCQIYGTIAYFAWAFGTSALLFGALRAMDCLRVPREVELMGMGEHHHAGAAFCTKSMKAGEGKALDDSSASSHKEPMEEIFPKVDNDKCEELRHRKITTALKPGQV